MPPASLFQGHKSAGGKGRAVSIFPSNGNGPVSLSVAALLQVGLGTDVAGGYSASMLDCIRQTMIATNVCGMKPDEDGNTWKPLRYTVRVCVLSECRGT